MNNKQLIIFNLLLFLATTCLLQISFLQPAFAQKDDLIVDEKSVPRVKHSSTNDDTILYQRDSETGILNSGHSLTKDDNIRCSLLYHFNANLYNISQISSFEFIFAKQLQYPSLPWLELFFSMTSATFSQIAKNNEHLGEDNVMLDDSKDDLFSLGMGLGYRFKTIQTLLKGIIDSNTIFETTTAFLTYHSLNERYYSQKFTGVGLRADFGIHKRTALSWHYGLRFSYNIAPVKRSAMTSAERSHDRSLNLAWITLAIDLAFYF